MVINYIVFCICLCVVNLIQGITGFGAIVLALPVLIFFFPLKVLIPSLVAVNLVQSLYFSIRERKHLKPGPTKAIVFLSLAGLPVGYAIYKYLPAEELKLALGVFVVIVAVYNLAGMEIKRQVPLAYYHFLNFLGGIAQGALACGGPFLVIYAAKVLPNKSAFRASLSVAWASLNIVLCLAYTVNGVWSMEMVPLIGFAFPCIIFGTVLGILLHSKIAEKPFKQLVFIILFISGLVLLRPLLHI